MPRRSALLAAAAALACVGSGGATAVASGAAAPTEVRHVSPVDEHGALRPGYHVPHEYGGARCQRGSAMTGTAYRCFTQQSPAGVYDPCWVAKDSHYAMCVVVPWKHRAIRLHVTGGYDDTDRFGHQSLPWGVQLATGQRCLLHPAAVQWTHDRPIHYYCSHNIALAGPLDRSHASWRVHAYRNRTPHALSASYESLGRVHVRVGWRAEPSRTD